MDSFSITTRTTVSDYVKILYTGFYRKPTFLIVSIFGLFCIWAGIFAGYDVVPFDTGLPGDGIYLGCLFVLFPSLMVLIGVRQFRSNPVFRHDMTFSFGETGFKVQGLTFAAEFQWAYIIKQREIGHYLILYHSKRMGSFIDKRALTTEQLQFIKSKVKRR
ncbi:MAG TPA: YcxB family protein [Puia sp.]|nr:YcxB family protein [Puia sp.]